MNFLAHIVLSGDDDELLVGNFMGDFVKGSQWKALPERIGHGCLLHRFIDYETDNHPLSAELRTYLHPVVGKYAPVALDMLFDHILAHDFHRYQELQLSEFASESYSRLQKKRAFMPPHCAYLFDRMREQDWLVSYATYSGLEGAMLRLERRIGRSIGFEGVRSVFEAENSRFVNGFHLIFPELQQRCSEKIISFAGHGRGLQ